MKKSEKIVAAFGLGVVALGTVWSNALATDDEQTVAATSIPTLTATPTPTPSEATEPGVEGGIVTEVVDGDTIVVAGYGTVRLVGIDAPESGQCGWAEATKALSDLVAGEVVTLKAGAHDDRDTHNRLLRYVEIVGKDAGAALLNEGLARSRYDSRDGYGEHTREAEYIRLDENSPQASACEPTPTPTPTPTPKPKPKSKSKPKAEPTPAAEPAAEPWNEPGPDLDCPDIGHPVVITGPDYHRLDRDGDGIGCDA